MNLSPGGASFFPKSHVRNTAEFIVLIWNGWQLLLPMKDERIYQNQSGSFNSDKHARTSVQMRGTTDKRIAERTVDMAGTKLFTVTMTFDQNLWNLRKWSIVWNYRRWLLLNEIISSSNCGWFGTGRRWLSHLWYCWMFPPQVIWGRAYGYCCLSSHTGGLISLPVSPGGKAHGSK